jgi:hypothetical protein
MRRREIRRRETERKRKRQKDRKTEGERYSVCVNFRTMLKS